MRLGALGVREERVSALEASYAARKNEAEAKLRADREKLTQEGVATVRAERQLIIQGAAEEYRKKFREQEKRFSAKVKALRRERS